ncbi:hypothetical protein A2U01_0075585 [Trifolium medium]|uniref:Uncharacterized protein n=1 Tax=Trifolium medium TaxID=97028 RepID=A0A392T1Z4_9FABA|nr:hypothetical protein [Trifolium medium]
MARRPVKERLYVPNTATKNEEYVEGGDMEADDLLDSEPELNILVNVVSIAVVCGQK